MLCCVCVVLCCVVLCVVCCCVVVLCCVLCLVRPSVVVRRRRPPSVRPVRPSPSSVVVVLCPSVRPVRQSPSSVFVKLRIQGRMQILEKNSKYESYSLGTEIRIELDLEISLAGRKLLCVLKKLVLWTKHFCFRILVPMSILTCWA